MVSATVADQFPKGLGRPGWEKVSKKSHSRKAIGPIKSWETGDGQCAGFELLAHSNGLKQMSSHKAFE